MVEFDFDKIQRQLNEKLAEGMKHITAKIEAAQQTLHLDMIDRPACLVYFSHEGESSVISLDRWEALGQPGTLTLFIGASEPIDPDGGGEPAPSVKDPMSKISTIQVMNAGCTEVTFTNGLILCSAIPEAEDSGFPNLRGEQYEYVCQNPECPKGGGCGGQCVRDF